MERGDKTNCQMIPASQYDSLGYTSLVFTLHSSHSGPHSACSLARYNLMMAGEKKKSSRMTDVNYKNTRHALKPPPSMPTISSCTSLRNRTSSVGNLEQELSQPSVARGNGIH